MLARLVVPDQPPRLLWLVLVVVVAGFGLWRASRAAAAGNELAGVTLAGLVGALVSPITWPHHMYWFIPAVIVIIDAAAAEPAGRRRRALVAFAVAAYTVSVFGVVSFIDWGIAMERTDAVLPFLLRNLYVLLSLVLIAALPTRSAPDVGLYHISRKIDRSVRTT